MKTFLLTAAVAMLGFSSCKKDYTCECTTTSPTGTTTSSENTGKMKLSDAKAKCNDGDKTYEVLGQTYSTDCTIKS